MTVPVFLDTIGLLATWDTSDQWHTLAQPVFEKIVQERRPIVTTSLILLECGNAAARRPYRSTVARFNQDLRASNRLIIPTDDDYAEAWRTYAAQDQTGAGVVDQVRSSSCEGWD